MGEDYAAGLRRALAGTTDAIRHMAETFAAFREAFGPAAAVEARRRRLSRMHAAYRRRRR
jgi:hypothetical protein